MDQNPPKNLTQKILTSYRHVIIVAGLFLLLGLLYSRTTIQILGEWSGNGPYSHGLLAIPISLYLFWLDRYKLNIAAHFHWLPVLGLFASMGAWVMGASANVFIVEVIALFGVFVNTTALIYGVKVWRDSFAAIISIFLVLPFWNVLQLPLQHWSSEATHLILTWLDIPVFRDGFIFSVPGGNFHIEEACSGLGFLLSSCLLAVIYSRVFRLSLKNSVLLMVAAVAISILSNWFRIATIMVVGNMTKMQHPIVEDHLTFGWILFSVMLVPFFWIANKFVTEGDEPTQGNEPDVSNSLMRHEVKALLIISALILLAPLGSILLEQRAEPNNVALRGIVESVIPPSMDQSRLNWSPQYLGADSIEIYRGKIRRQEFIVLLVRYDSQQQGKELIFVENAMFDKGSWRVIDSDQAEAFEMTDIINNSGRRRLVAHTYFINKQITSNQRQAKMNELLALFNGDSSAYLVAIATPHKSDTSRDHLLEISTAIGDKLLTLSRDTTLENQ